ncbi:MAG TPA: hypothetical protein VHM64_13485, partial [Candidatus Binatia bacterium]|nr:hypothetical protein [Candidatus Binatia bacterium]
MPASTNPIYVCRGFLSTIASGELFSALRQAYLQLEAGTRLRAIVDKNPRQTYIGFVEAGIPHRTAQLAEGEW